jgi:D-alanine-D-alanine ligase
MKVAILHGWVAAEASADERDVLVQVEAVGAALLRLGHDPVPVPLSIDLQGAVERLQSICPDLVFNLVEAVQGRGQLIHLAPALLDYLQLPHTGASTEALFLTSNKILAKKQLAAANIATPPWVTGADATRGETAFPTPGIIKSIWEHASIGLDEHSVIFAASHLRREFEQRRQVIAGGCFVEAFIEGREFNVALLAGQQGPEVLPVAEIHFVDYPQDRPKVVGYRAKWDAASFEYHHTPRCFDFSAEDQGLLARLADLARDCWRLFELRGYARVDFRIDHTGQPWVLEVNANPCISPDGGFVAAAEQRGLSYDEVIARIIQDSKMDGVCAKRS